MAAYFQLRRKDDGSLDTFQRIDREICQRLGLEFNDRLYACWWYDVIGFNLAMGITFQEITDILKTEMEANRKDADEYTNLIRINHHLMENYDAVHWRGR